MPTVQFYHKTTPVINGSSATVCIRAAEISPGSLVIIDHAEGGDSDNVDAVPGATPQDQARPGTVARIVDIAGRRGLSIVPGDVTEIEEP